MIKELHNITIIPARFLEKRDDKYILRCYLDEGHYQDRIFDSYSLEGIENPKYILIGIMTGVGVMQATFTDANRFESLFKKKWKLLTQNQ